MDALCGSGGPVSRREGSLHEGGADEPVGYHARHRLGRRRREHERRSHRVQALRQRDGGEGLRRRCAEDGVADRVSAAGTDPLPARGGLRRLRQRRPSAQLAPLHGFPAHGRRVQLHNPAPGRRAGPHPRALVSGREPPGQGLHLRRSHQLRRGLGHPVRGRRSAD